MNKLTTYFRISLACLWLLFVLMTLTACGNDDKQDEPNTDGMEVDEQQLWLNKKDSLSRVFILNNFAQADTAADGTVHYEPKLGQVIYPEYPAVRYVKVSSLEAARRQALTLMQGVDELATISNGQQLHYKDLTLTYHEGGFNNTGLASIDVNIPELPTLRKLVFVRADEWPLNDKSSWTVGDVYEKDGRFYLCLDDSYWSVILITFDLPLNMYVAREKAPNRDDIYLISGEDHFRGEWTAMGGCAGSYDYELFNDLVNSDDPIIKDKINQILAFENRGRLPEAIRIFQQKEAKSYWCGTPVLESASHWFHSYKTVTAEIWDVRRAQKTSRYYVRANPISSDLHRAARSKWYTQIKFFGLPTPEAGGYRKL